MGAKQAIPVQFFSIDTNPDVSASPTKAPVSLWIPNFTASQRCRQQILYRSDEYEISYKELDRWVERPEEMVTRVFARIITDSGAFQDVVYGAIPKPADYTLEGYVLEFDEIRSSESWKARFSIRLVLYKTLERRTVWSAIETVEKPMEFHQSVDLARAMSDAVAEVAENVLKEMVQAVRQDIR